jgi:hypothetical protein
MSRQLPRRRFTPCSSLLLLGLGATLLLPADAAIAKQQSWLQWLRKELGFYNPPLAPGGSRGPTDALGAADGMLCLITPQLKDSKTPTAVVALPNPTILSQGPLAEWALYDGQGYKLKGALARSDKPLEGEIVWPLAPLQPGQTVTLRLRPMQASGSEYVQISLEAASAREQAEASRLLEDRRDRLEVVQELVKQGKPSLARELVFAPLEKPSPALLELRRFLVATGCVAKS